ncbi:hypothetical protein OG762_12865 [Streptomyces sp. NBC_01136]|uniref:hypothetical protein n=1 Tax=unclassified Streptomyces TaxID=2593676 RepID=UPI00324DF730|nr:hypothetical protein OG762_12865 [Streptomyces sp. NBC_01136]
MKLLRNHRLLTTVMTLATVAVGTVIVLGATLGGWKLGLHTDDRAIIVNTALVIDTCILTAVAAFLALLAYRAATGLPSLDVAVTFNFSFPNEPVFVAASGDDDEASSGEQRRISNFKQSLATVTLTNSSTYAAKNPGVRIELEGLGGRGEQPGWEQIAFVTTVGMTQIQWDGGTDSIVHGQWSRTLPRLDLGDVQELLPGATALVVTIVADGITPIVKRLPVRILSSDEYSVYTEDRARRFALT